MSRAITIVSKIAGFRRCGMAHPDEAVTHEAGTFTDAQIALLEAEPVLVVTDAANGKTASEKTAREGIGDPAPEPEPGPEPEPEPTPAPTPKPAAKKAPAKKGPSGTAKKTTAQKTTSGKSGPSNIGTATAGKGKQA